MKKLFYIFLLCHTFRCIAQLPFNTIDTNFSTTTLQIPNGFSYNALFSGNASYVYTTAVDSFVAKQMHDFIGYCPLGTDSAWVIVNHEVGALANPGLGDGGGQTAFKMAKTNGAWQVVQSKFGKKYHDIDFSLLGGTWKNCGGTITPYNYTLVGEEFPPNTNLDVINNGLGILDTSNYTIPTGNGMYSGKTIKRFENYGWNVETNPYTQTATKKYYSMGRYSHEGTLCMPDGYTVYLCDDSSPAVFFKFIANLQNNYTEGTLYAYKQNANGAGGSWLSLPNDLDSLIDIKNIAFKKGATLFNRFEWIVKDAANNIFISETGLDLSNFKAALMKGANMANHLLPIDTIGNQPMDSILIDYYGRILIFNDTNNHVQVYLNGGTGLDGKTNFSNPDALSTVTQNEQNYLVICEDILGLTQGRMPLGKNYGICENYYLNTAIKNPVLEDLHRFVIGPIGAELTGGTFTPNGQSYFLNIQHPYTSNTIPFNNSTTVVIDGFLFNNTRDIARAKKNIFTTYKNDGIFVYVNKDCLGKQIKIYNISGILIYSKKITTNTFSIILPGGIYFASISEMAYKHKFIVY